VDDCLEISVRQLNFLIFTNQLFGVFSMPSNHEAVLERIGAVDLGPIRFKLANPDEGRGWERPEIERVEEEYRRFLLLTALESESVIVPSREVDKFWHAHILDTKKYAYDCQAIFGYFLHHFPYLGTRGDGDAKALCEAYAATNRLYASRFGNSPLRVSDHVNSSVCGASCGGSCSAGCGGNNVNATNADSVVFGIDMESRPTLV
jgi:hypothetical protein